MNTCPGTVWLPVSPERAFRRHTAKSSRLPWISRALRAQMRPAAACRAPYFAGAASSVSYCVGECVGECVGDVHDLTRATRVAKPLQQAVSAPPATARADPDRVSSSGRCRCCRSCCRYFWRRGLDVLVSVVPPGVLSLGERSTNSSGWVRSPLPGRCLVC